MDQHEADHGQQEHDDAQEREGDKPLPGLIVWVRLRAWLTRPHADHIGLRGRTRATLTHFQESRQAASPAIPDPFPGTPLARTAFMAARISERFVWSVRTRPVSRRAFC